MAETTYSDADLRELIACPSCDALYRAPHPADGERAVCPRCHHVLVAPVEGAVARIVALAIAIAVLLGTAVFVPFLKIEANGLAHSASIFDAARAFSKEHMVFLAIATLSLIVFIPLARALLLIHALAPLIIGAAPLPGARTAFRWSEELRPWSMAEIFVLGVGVALVKLADMARVELGSAFWLFALLVLVTVLQDGYLCRWSVWAALDRGRQAGGGSGAAG